MVIVNNFLTQKIWLVGVRFAILQCHKTQNPINLINKMKKDDKLKTTLEQLEEYKEHLVLETVKLTEAIYNFHLDFQNFLESTCGDVIDDIIVSKLYNSATYVAYLRKALSYFSALQEINSESLMVNDRLERNKPF